eukprot:COSAG05_NODE_1011_length_6206_cov_2.116751_5_plen_65_part_00
MVEMADDDDDDDDDDLDAQDNHMVRRRSSTYRLAGVLPTPRRALEHAGAEYRCRVLYIVLAVLF